MLTQLATRAGIGPRGWVPSSTSRIVALLALSAFGGLLQSCDDARRDSSELDVRVEFDPLPYIGESTCRIALFDQSGHPISGARVEVEGNMNHAGMVPVLASATELEAGRYSAPFEFTMGGDWILMLNIELADGTTVDEVFDVPAVPVKREPGMSPDRSRPIKR